MSAAKNGFVTKRLAAGGYEVTLKGDPNKRVVTVTLGHYFDGLGWVASAGWVSDVYSDPYDTKREAVQAAILMLKCWDAAGKHRENHYDHLCPTQ